MLCNCSGLIYKNPFPTITVSIPIWLYFSKQKISCSTFLQQYAAYSLEKINLCSIHGPVKWALSLPDWSSGTPVPIAPVTPHWEDVLPAISPQPARQQCRDALTKHTDVKYRTRGRHPCGAPAWHHCHWPTLHSQKCEPLGTVWGQSVGIDKDYSLRHIVFLLYLCLQAGLPCHWHYVTDTTPANRGEDLRQPLCSVVDQRSRLWLPLSAVVPDAWLCVKRSGECAPCDRTAVSQEEAAKLPPSGHGGHQLRKPRFLQAVADLN